MHHPLWVTFGGVEGAVLHVTGVAPARFSIELQLEGMSGGRSGLTPVRVMLSSPITTGFARQNFLRCQNNKTNYNLVCETLQFLDIMCGSTTGGLGLLGLYINEYNVALITQTLETLTEYCQGPCHENQVRGCPGRSGSLPSARGSAGRVWGRRLGRQQGRGQLLASGCEQEQNVGSRGCQGVQGCRAGSAAPAWLDNTVLQMGVNNIVVRMWPLPGREEIRGSWRSQAGPVLCWRVKLGGLAAPVG